MNTEPIKSTGQRLQELRRSNASGTMKDKRTKRMRDKSTIKRISIQRSQENQ